MKKYTKLHLWMIIPMIIMQLGIYANYWGDFSDNAWPVHVHYWTGTLWYVYLIIQPYYATHGKLDKHRTNGIIGMFLAGGVAITALAMLDRDIETIARSAASPENFGPFKPYFFYGVVVIEIVMMTAFIIAVLKSIIHRKNLENHAWWLIITVFVIMMPALGRGIQNIWVGMNAENWPDIDIVTSIYFTNVLIIVLILLTAFKFKHLKHPATYLAIGVNIFNCFLPIIGKSLNVQAFVDWLIRI